MDREGRWSGVRCDAPKYLAVVCKFAPSGAFTSYKILFFPHLYILKFLNKMVLFLFRAN